jgi:mannan endo-1,4-beta-mannosidase
VLARTSSLTGKKYTEDPAIMAWEIINEPRPMASSAVPAFEQWMKHVAALIKSLDKNHLVTTGSEGDIASSDDMSVFERVHADRNIDYITIHIWPKNWGWFRDTAIAAGFDNILAKTKAYAERHIGVAQQLNKPLVIEEFGLPRDRHSFDIYSTTASRDKYYRFVFDIVKNNKGIAGCNFWAFGGLARPVPGQVFWKNGDEFMGDPGGEEQGLNSVFDSDAATWTLIRKYSRFATVTP